MGADLYLEPNFSRTRDAMQPKFEEAARKRDRAHKRGDEAAVSAAQAEVNEWYDRMYDTEDYFRDSYNPSSVMAAIGLSWWRDVIPMLDADDNLSAERCEALAAEIESREVPYRTAAELEAVGCIVDDNENNPESWRNYFLRERESLVRFFRRAAAAIRENGANLRCSL